MAMVIGANVPETFPIFIRHSWALLDRGGTLICVDPRETTLARVAQLHRAIRPGTDAALLNAMLHVIVAEDLVDITADLAALYAITFGGFVAFGVYLPTYLAQVYSLETADAGALAAWFIVLATFARPVGGGLSDRLGGVRVLVPRRSS